MDYLDVEYNVFSRVDVCGHAPRAILKFAKTQIHLSVSIEHFALEFLIFIPVLL